MATLYVWNGTSWALQSNVSGYNSSWLSNRNGYVWNGTSWELFTLQPPAVPTLSSPANGATSVNSATLTWNADTNATTYELFVNGNSQYSGADTSFNATGLTSGTTYSWYVIASNTAGSEQSDTWSFTTIAAVATPTLSSPTNGQSNVDEYPLYLDCNSDTNATSYEFYVVDNGEYITSNTSVEPNDIAPATTYNWYVIASNAFSNAQSDTWSFSTIPQPIAPTLTSPANGATSISPNVTFSWSTVANADGYILYLNGEVAYEGSSTSTSGTLAYSTTYSWYVEAYNNMWTSQASDTWTFTTESS